MAYIVVATEYLTKWAEAKAVRTNDAKNAAIFLFENVITRFGVPKFLVSNRATLWAYRTTFKVTTQATPFSLVYGLEAVLPIEFEVPSLRIAVDSRLTDKQSLKTRFYELEALDESRRRGAQHIEAIQRRRKVVFDKRNKTRVLQPGMLVLLQDARKIDFPSKFDAIWLGPYLIKEVFLNNSVQLEILNGQLFPTRTSGSRCKEYKT
ncbi:uncharacterized protein [Physcomitrium patens]|uniref:uncharacterized protein n=1 Tax=Physcomitrium patens TaxID=3218 RepID=UPI003CCE2590